MPDAGRQIVRKNGVPKVVQLAPREIWVSKSKVKMLEKKPKKKRAEMKRNKEGRPKQKWSIAKKKILGLITLKHSLGLLILSFGTPNLGLHYVL